MSSHIPNASVSLGDTTRREALHLEASGAGQCDATRRRTRDTFEERDLNCPRLIGGSIPWE